MNANGGSAAGSGGGLDRRAASVCSNGATDSGGAAIGLAGVVEVDETYIGGEEPGLAGGRARGKKVLTGVAVEVQAPKGVGRCPRWGQRWWCYFLA